MKCVQQVGKKYLDTFMTYVMHGKSAMESPLSKRDSAVTFTKIQEWY